MPTTNERRGHRTRFGGWLVALAVPALLAAGCTRVSDPNEDVLGTGDVTTDAAEESGSGDTNPPASVPSSDPPPDTSSPSTEARGDTTPPTTPATTPDAGDGGTTPAVSEPDPTEADQAPGDSSDDDSDEDDGSTDPTVVTIGAILGAGLLLGVAVLWMLRMNRSDAELGVDADPTESTPPDPFGR